MADYIDRKELLEDLERFAPECRAAFLIIEKQEAVDAVPVVHGRWLDAPTVAFTEECSVCRSRVLWDDGGLHEYNYCPYCGATMDLEVE